MEADQTGEKDILELDIEQLGSVDVVVPSLDVEVSTVSRQESTVGRTPAAVFVITPEMIRRSGATSIPEALRMAWRPNRRFEISVVGQNLLDNHHLEFPGADVFNTEVDRGAYGRVTWRY